MVQRFLAGWIIGGNRGERWSWARRARNIGGAPLIPAVIVWGIRASLVRLGRTQRLPPGTLPALLLATILSAGGEIAGYIFGAARIASRSDEYELHKLRYTLGPVPANEF